MTKWITAFCSSGSLRHRRRIGGRGWSRKENASRSDVPIRVAGFTRPSLWTGDQTLSPPTCGQCGIRGGGVHRMQWGVLADLKARLKALGLSGRLNTAFVERVNLSIRQCVSLLTRRTWGTAQTAGGLGLHLAWWRGCISSEDITTLFDHTCHCALSMSSRSRQLGTLAVVGRFLFAPGICAHPKRVA